MTTARPPHPEQLVTVRVSLARCRPRGSLIVPRSVRRGIGAVTIEPSTMLAVGFPAAGAIAMPWAPACITGWRSTVLAVDAQHDEPDDLRIAVDRAEMAVGLELSSLHTTRYKRGDHCCRAIEGQRVW